MRSFFRIFLPFTLLQAGPLILGVTSEIYASDQTEQIFTHIYDNRIWGTNEQGRGTSGGGSLIENSGEYIAFLNTFIKKNKIRSIVDIGCGDWQIMKYANLQDATYLGVDVVKSVIDTNTRLFGSSKVRFLFGDCLDADLPAADLLLCKDVLIHFSNANIFALIPQFKKYKHVLITTDVDPDTFTCSNKDCQLGDWRRVDVSAAPFFLTGKKLLIYPAETYQNHFKLVFYIQN